MGNPYNVIKGDKLSQIGLWFLLTYLYSKYVDQSETRYENRKDYKKWCDEIDDLVTNEEDVIIAWLDYSINKLQKTTPNDGNVSFQEQKIFAFILIMIFDSNKNKRCNKGTIKSIIKRVNSGKTETYVILNMDLKVNDKQLIKTGLYYEVDLDMEFKTNIDNIDIFDGKKCFFEFKKNKSEYEIIEIGFINE